MLHLLELGPRCTHLILNGITFKELFRLLTGTGNPFSLISLYITKPLSLCWSNHIYLYRIENELGCPIPASKGRDIWELWILFSANFSANEFRTELIQVCICMAPVFKNSRGPQLPDPKATESCTWISIKRSLHQVFLTSGRISSVCSHSVPKDSHNSPSNPWATGKWS